MKVPFLKLTLVSAIHGYCISPVNKTLVKLLLLCMFSPICSIAQTKSFGQGKIKVDMFYFLSTNIIKKDASVNHLTSFTYFIDGQLILRDNHLNKRNQIAEHQSTQQSEGIKTTLTSSIDQPRFLLDWKRKLSYTFFTKGNDHYAFKQSLENNEQEIFYRRLAIANSIMINVEDIFMDRKSELTLLGKKCYQVSYKQKDSSLYSLIYTIEDIGIYSPLNSFVSPKFPYSILSIDIPNTGKATDPDEGTNQPKLVISSGITRFQINEIDLATLDKTIFTLPKDIIFTQDQKFENKY